MTDILLCIIIVLLVVLIFKGNDVFIDTSKTESMTSDLKWLRRYFEKKSKNKWDETFYDPDNKNI